MGRIVTVRSYTLGHPIFWMEGEGWKLNSTGERLTDTVEKSLSCVKCGLKATTEGHDPCIANLPGVKNACCGHGVNDGQQAYVQYEDDSVIRFDTTEDLLKHVGRP